MDTLSMIGQISYAMTFFLAILYILLKERRHAGKILNSIFILIFLNLLINIKILFN